METVGNPRIASEGGLVFSFLGRVRYWHAGRTQETAVSATVDLGPDGPSVEHVWPVSVPGYLIDALDDCLIDACADRALRDPLSVG